MPPRMTDVEPTSSGPRLAQERGADGESRPRGALADGAIAVSLFSGAGGLDKGIEDAGFTVAAAVEWDGDAADTMEKNFPSLRTPVLRRDIRDGATDELLDAAGLRGGERPDLLVSGPPCVAFSKSGFWLDYKRAGNDPAAGLLQAYTRVLREAQPRAFIMENVYALTFKNCQSRPHFLRLLEEIVAAREPLSADLEPISSDRTRYRVPRCWRTGGSEDVPERFHRSPERGLRTGSGCSNATSRGRHHNCYSRSSRHSQTTPPVIGTANIRPYAPGI
ncbi:MAG: DNA cytosine methyltransferase [Actinomycetota bacterium]